MLWLVLPVSTHTTQHTACPLLKLLCPRCSQLDVKAWLKTAPGFEGEVVKRMLKTIGEKVRSAPNSRAGGARPAPVKGRAMLTGDGPAERVPTPNHDHVSKWAGI